MVQGQHVISAAVHHGHGPFPSLAVQRLLHLAHDVPQGPVLPSASGTHRVPGGVPRGEGGSCTLRPPASDSLSPSTSEEPARYVLRTTKYSPCT